jgi:alpha-L-fucosidase
VNGEAIFGTRTWEVFGEGPTHNAGGMFSERNDKPYTAGDIRFTTKGDTIYAIMLGWPDSREVSISSLGSNLRLLTGEIRQVALLGSDATLYWSHEAASLRVKLPSTQPCRNAYVLKIAPK